MVRQNLILFAGGLVAGIGGFVYHAIAGRVLGPAIYGQVAFLIAVYAVGTAPALILVVVLARYTATLSGARRRRRAVPADAHRPAGRHPVPRRPSS